MKNKLTAALLFAASCSTLAADSKPAFSCDQIKDAKVRATCIESMKPQSNDSAQATTPSTSKPLDSVLDSARQALRALRKLDARVSTGISYREYPAALSDAKFEVEQFLDSRAAEGTPDLTNLMQMILLRYEEAKLLWDNKFRKDGIYKVLTSDIMQSKGDGLFVASSWSVTTDRKMQAYIDSLNAAYPGIAYQRDWGKEKAVTASDYPKTGTMVDIDKGVAIIWAKASSDVATLAGMLR